jgi:hypothetical protein
MHLTGVQGPDWTEHSGGWLPDQADFSFYFDTGGRRRCYIAPERFYESGAGDAAQLAAQPLRPEMVSCGMLHACIRCGHPFCQ